jgi:cytochrome c peroxidase
MTIRRRFSFVAAIGAAVLVFTGLVFLVAVTDKPAGDTAQAAGDPHAPVTLSADEMQRLQNAVEAISQSPENAAAVAKGRELFRSNSLAKAGESCQGCHTDGGSNPDIGTTPHKVGGVGVATDFDGLRDPPSLYGVGSTAPYFWNGNVPVLEQVADATIQNHFADNGGGAADPGDTGQKGVIDAIGMTPADAAARLAAYMRTIEAPESDFSQGTMSAAARAGLVLFQGQAGCIGCHFGDDLTDNRLHDILVPQVALPAAMGVPGNLADDPRANRPPPELGSGKCPLDPLLVNIPLTADPRNCAINTPTLRGVSRTPPFMHNGRFATLEEVVSFYNGQSIIAPLNLTPAQQAQIVEFLRSL